MQRVEARTETVRSSEESPEGHRFLFIGGVHKSGTSIFHRCLGDHPEISRFAETGVPEDEGQLLQRTFPPAREFGGMGRFALHRDARLDESSPLASRRNALKIFDAWSRHWDLSRPVLAEKSPPTIVRSRFLQALFPDSYFVFLVRHPIAVAYSTHGHTGRPLHALIAHWCVCHERLAADFRHLRRAMVVRYEDFVADPQAEVERVWRFAGLAPYSVDRPVTGRINDRYLLRWRAMRWRPRARRYSNVIRERYGDRVRRLGFGYSLDP